MICFFCFYNQSSGIQSSLSFHKDFKHCNLITFDGELWLAHEFDKSGMIVQRVNVYTASSLIRGLKYVDSVIALVVVDVRERDSISWKPFLVRSCNELDRYISGVEIGFTFNPFHLYNKLLKCKSKKFDVLYAWRR